MRRLRLVFLLVAGTLLVPLGLLLHKALASVEVEREIRHRAVAERIIDEMERELSIWLRSEEDRPYAHYRYLFLPDNMPVSLGVYERSPLADPAPEPFIIGPFQLNPDGAFETPLWPREDILTSVSTTWDPSEDLRQRVADVRQTVEGLWAMPSVGGKEGDGLEKQLAGTGEQVLGQMAGKGEQVAGTTVALEKKKRIPEKKQRGGVGSALEDTLKVLNRGAEERRQRSSKLVPTQAANVYGSSEIEDSDLFSSVVSRGQARRDTTEFEPVAEGLSALPTVDVFLEPMVGRPAQAGRLVLYRTVLIQQQAYRQGVVLHRETLVRWLGQRVLEVPDFAVRARVELAVGEGPASQEGDEYAYRHRFAEPFAALSIILTLEPLEGAGGSQYLYTLAGLLLLATTVGLFALYRMVAVVVSFSERRGNFVSAVTHELKTPLTALRMYAEMLRDGMVSSEEKRQRYYEILTAETERLTRLVNNVLELSRLENKSRNLELRVGEVGPLLDEVVTVLGPHAESLGFHLRVEREEGLPLVRFDRDALLQVLFNLVDNALKYSRKAEAKEIVLRCQSGEGGVELLVADRGPGVRRRHLRKIFEPFYRGESELTRTAKGTGIGLALVRGLVLQMGGSVGGRNREDGGFEVRLAFPATS
jgi:signal transduction histidine kinase